jgi:hypothetical protein
MVVAAVMSAPRGAQAQTAKDRAYVDAVLDGLVKAGVLQAAQAEQIKQDAEAAAQAAGEEKPKPKWTDTVKVSGYAQTRFQHYPDAEGDDPDNEFLVRRARVKVTASPTDRMEGQFEVELGEGEVAATDAWLQYDASPGGNWRVRAGQQRMPFGFEVPQPTQLVLPLEPSWVGRTMFPGLRDTGVVVYWTRPADRALFDGARKQDFGTGDYGNLAVGVFNGQGMNETETNDGKHVSIRLAKPFELGDRYAEAGVSYITGSYTSAAADADVDDELLGAHFYLPPRPLGLQAEYYTGETEGGDLDGYYAMGLWRPEDDQVAFVRYDQYRGPRKGRGLGNVFDRDRWSLGYAYYLNDATKLTAEYDLQGTEGGSDDLFGLQVQMGF